MDLFFLKVVELFTVLDVLSLFLDNDIILLDGFFLNVSFSYNENEAKRQLSFFVSLIYSIKKYEIFYTA